MSQSPRGRFPSLADAIRDWARNNMNVSYGEMYAARVELDKIEDRDECLGPRMYAGVGGAGGDFTLIGGYGGTASNDDGPAAFNPAREEE